MTSQKSSGNKTAVKKGAVSRASMYSYVTGLTACLPSAIGIFVFLSFIYPGFTAYTLSSMKRTAELAMLEGGTATKLADTLKYTMCSIPEISAFAIVFVIGFAIFAGIRAFGFSADKRTVNVYYSLGIKRVSLFSARYLAGATMLLASTVLPIVFCAIVNTIYIGVNSYLVAATVLYSVGLFTTALFAYSVTAAVFSSVGTIIEGVAFSLGVLLSPTVIIFAVQVFVTSILYGAPYGDSYRLADGTYVGGGENSMVTSLSAYNPLLFFYDYTQKYANCGIENKEVVLGTTNTQPWETPSYGLLILWLIATVAAFGIGMLLFKKHKAEDCGFIGKNKVLNTVMTFVFGFFAFAFCIYFIQRSRNDAAMNENVAIGALIGCVAFAVIYTGIELFLKRSFKLYAKTLWKLPINLAVCALVTVIFATGGLGYSQKIPNIKNIKSADISLPLDTSALGTMNISPGYSDGIHFFSDPIACLLQGVTDTQDIELIEDLHGKLIKDKDTDNGIKCDVVINYNLKNGSVVSRRYKLCSKDTFTYFSKFFDTKYTDEKINDVFTKEQSPDNNLRYLNYGESNILVAIGADFATQNPLDLTETQWNALKEALAKDLTGISGEEYYFSSNKQLGMLMFSMIYDAEYYGLDEDSFNISAIADSYDFVQSIQYGKYECYTVTVSENMKNTLSYLESIGQKDCFTAQKTVKSVSFEKYAIDVPQWVSDYYTPSPVFEAKAVETMENSYGENKQTDKAKIDEIMSLSKLNAVTPEMNGYRVIIVFEDGTGVVKFLSEKDAPAYVSSFNYSDVQAGF